MQLLSRYNKLGAVSQIKNNYLFVFTDPEIRSHLLSHNLIELATNLLDKFSAQRRILIATLTTFQLLSAAEPSVHSAIYTAKTCAKVTELRAEHQSDVALFNLAGLFVREQNGQNCPVADADVH